MKHEVTTLNTKKALAASLKKAMRAKPFSKITVTEIITDCGVNRKTFYYHFQDIYALLKWMLEEEAIEVVKQFDLLVDYEEAIAFVMDYVEQNDYILSCACDSIGLEEMKRFLYADFIELVNSIIQRAETDRGVTLDPDYKQFLAQFYTEALAGMLVSWIRSRDALDREKVVEYLSRTFRKSLLSILDGEP
ncbi:MAG: TetR/AcrR family transcriptional regulator C-terminal domain-containing protein [Candidatus Enterenecus sp.]